MGIFTVVDFSMRKSGGDRLKRTFQALGGRNFRLWYVGQGVSLLGTFLQQTALSWYLYRITGSAASLGRVALVSQLPTVLVVPFAGVLADRIPRQAGVMVTQAFMSIQAIALAWMVSTGRASEGMVLVLAGVLGLIMGFDIPIRQAFMSQVVARPEDLPNALSLNSALFNFARLGGPALAGLAVAAWGEAPCLWVNAASFLAVIAALASLRPSPPASVPKGGLGGEFREGFRLAWRDRDIRGSLLLVAAMSLGSLSVLPLLPVVAVKMIGGGPRELGLLMSAAGAGALVATLTLAGRADFSRWRFKSVRSALIAATGVIALSFARTPWQAYSAMALAGYGTIQVTTGSNAFLQSRVEERLRGRIVSLFVLAFAGTSPLGSLFLGHLAVVAGIRTTVLVSGLFCLLAALVWAAPPGFFRPASTTPIGAEPGG